MAINLTSFYQQQQQQQQPVLGGGAGFLTVLDNRTGREYCIEIKEGGVVHAKDINKIRLDEDGSGLVLFDQGYSNTAIARYAISYADGEKGTLRFRGYPLEELAENSTFLEVAYLLIYGDLPGKSKLSEWEASIKQNAEVPKGALTMIECQPRDAHPMGMLAAAISSLSSFYATQNGAAHGKDAHVKRILGQIPRLAATICLHASGRQPLEPSPELSYVENFLHMLHVRSDPRLVRVLEIMFIFHMEHEMSCSAAASRHLASCGVDLYTTIAAAVGTLYGPFHGGANEATLKMLLEIQSVDKIPGYLNDVKSRKKKLFGFGHRVYKSYESRVKMIRSLAEEVFAVVGRDPLIEVADALAKAARSDEYFIKRRLFPNVDFYSSIVFRNLGFPVEFFPVLFAMARSVGYLTHWKESLDSNDSKIIRPQQLYIGEELRRYNHKK